MKNVKWTANNKYNEWAHYIGETVLIQHVHYELKGLGSWEDGTTYIAPIPIAEEEVKEVLIQDVALEEMTDRVYVKYKDVITQEEKWMWPHDRWMIVGVLDMMKHGTEEEDMPEKEEKG